MRFYQEITLIKTPEITPYFIWSKLYIQVHLALVEQQNSDKTVNFGVSFPKYRYEDKEGRFFASLGSKLRVFAPTEVELQRLNLAQWLERLVDYVHIKSIQSVPDNISCHVNVRRYRADTKLDRLTRRYAKRRGISFEEARAEQNQRFADTHNLTLHQAQQHYIQPKVKDYPFIKLQSLSGEKEFSLLIAQVEAEQCCSGSFNTYGLSSQSTVPHW